VRVTREENVAIQLEDGGEMRAALVVPEAMQPGSAAVVAIHDILGLSPDIRRIARRLADGGYVALAPDLFDGRGSRVLCVARTLLALRRGEGEAFDRLEGARSWLAQHPQVDAHRIGVMGFCMGGGFALLFAQRAPLAVAAPFYGDVPQEHEALRGICPVVGGYGERDRFFAGAGRRLVSHLRELGVEHDVAFYPDAGHSYMNDHRGVFSRLGRFTPMHARYDEGAAEDSWRRVFEFFGRVL
jgi:carboxymethylenebutenolidase